MLELAPDMRPAPQQQDAMLVLVDVVGSVAVALHGALKILQQFYDDILRPGTLVIVEEKRFQLRRTYHPVISLACGSRLILVQNRDDALVDLNIIASQHPFPQFLV